MSLEDKRIKGMMQSDNWREYNYFPSRNSIYSFSIEELVYKYLLFKNDNLLFELEDYFKILLEEREYMNNNNWSVYEEDYYSMFLSRESTSLLKRELREFSSERLPWNILQKKIRKLHSYLVRSLISHNEIEMYKVRLILK